MKPLFICCFFITLTIQAQSSISGTLTPATEYKWLIGYQLTPGGERYVADTEVKDGYFKLEMPANVDAGMYRLVYAVPQDEFYIDVLYDKKEDVQFNYDLVEGLTITNSIENKLFNEYFLKIDEAQSKLMDFYEEGNASKESFNAIIKNLNTVQGTYEEASKGKIAYTFIRANRSYVPEDFESLANYLQHKKSMHFNAIDFNSSILQSSSFVLDKISTYAFAMVTQNNIKNNALALEIEKNIATINEIVFGTPSEFQEKVFYRLWKIAGVTAMNTVADHIYSTYLKKIALANKNNTLITEIESTTRLRIGAISPDITWLTEEKNNSLYGLKKEDYYLLIFWSSTCSHCLNELPELHKALKNYKSLQIVAVGLEEETENWQKVSHTLPLFHHAIALGKWESDYARTFNIQKTPTYFILDGEKKIVAKPESDEGVIEFFEN